MVRVIGASVWIRTLYLKLKLTGLPLVSCDPVCVVFLGDAVAMIITEAVPSRTPVSQRGRGCLEYVGEQVASCPLGQILIRGADRLLWTVETSVQWFVESKEPEKDGSIPETSSRPDLVRPLPWVLFLPLLVGLRLVKTAAEKVAFLRGREPPSPLQVVRYIRVRRRRLRAVKYHGLRNFESWQRAEKNRQAEGDSMVLKVFSVGPLAKVAAFTGLGRVFTFLRGAVPVQPGKRKTGAEDAESSDDDEDLLEKIKRICHNYTSDEDPDYEPHEEEEESDDLVSCEENETEKTECQATAVTETNPNPVDQKSNELATSTSQDENQGAVVVTTIAADHQTTLATSDITFQQEKAETPDSDSQTLISTSSEDIAANDDSVKYQSEELDDSSLSLDSTEACSESTSQTFYSPVSSSSVTPEPKSSGPVTTAMTEETHAPESAKAFPKAPEVESEVSPLELSDNLVPLPTFTKSSDGSILSGAASSSKDVNEEVKGKSKFSDFFQIKKKSQSQKS